MRMIDRATAEGVLEPAALVDHFEACHRETRAVADDILLLDPVPGSGATFLCRGAWRSGKALGIKFGPVMPANAVLSFVSSPAALSFTIELVAESYLYEIPGYFPGGPSATS